MLSRGKRRYLEREYRAIQIANFIRRVAPHLSEERIAASVAFHRKLWDRKGGERHLRYTTASKADKKEFAAFSDYQKKLGEVSITDVPVRRLKIRPLHAWTPLEREEFREACKLAAASGIATLRPDHG